VELVRLDLRAARPLTELGNLWRYATSEERAEIAQNLFSAVRVRDQSIVSASLAHDEYLPLVASAWPSRCLRLGWRARRDPNTRCQPS